MTIIFYIKFIVWCISTANFREIVCIIVNVQVAQFSFDSYETNS